MTAETRPPLSVAPGFTVAWRPNSRHNGFALVLILNGQPHTVSRHPTPTEAAAASWDALHKLAILTGGRR